MLACSSPDCHPGCYSESVKFLKLRLAVGAIMTTSTRDNNSFDRRSTNQTRLAFSTVHPVLQLEKALFAVRINIVANGRPAQGNGFVQHFLNGGVEFAQLVARERHHTAAGPDARPEERFVGVDIADTAQ